MDAVCDADSEYAIYKFQKLKFDPLWPEKGVKLQVVYFGQYAITMDAVCDADYEDDIGATKGQISTSGIYK